MQMSSNSDNFKRTSNSRKMSPGVERSRKAVGDLETSFIPLLTSEPPRLVEEDFREMIMTAVYSGASDLTIQSDQQPRAEVYGRLYRGMKRALSATEVNMILIESYGGANGPTEINGGRILDYSYELNLPDGKRQRFRVNATGIYGRNGSGIELTFRVLPMKTPDIRSVKLTQDEVDAMTPRNGIVMIGGQTGSGKSTTMAAVTRYHLEESPRPVKIVDIQAPVEYTFQDVMSNLNGSPSVIGPSEVGRNIESFAAGVRSALRRKPNIINVGESRDFETISSSIRASLTGHLVYTTTHASSVSIAIRRMLTIFPGSERESQGYDLISAVRFIMIQHLVSSLDGRGVVPIREYLEFNDSLRERLIATPMEDWSTIIDQIVKGQIDAEGAKLCSLRESCERLYRNNEISRSDALRLGGPGAIGG